MSSVKIHHFVGEINFKELVSRDLSEPVGRYQPVTLTHCRKEERSYVDDLDIIFKDIHGLAI